MSFLGLFTSTAASDALTPEPPWKATTVVAAGMTTLAGMAGWMSDIVSPALARFGGSYLAGFFIGWAFRRFVKLVVVIGAFTLAGMALMKNVGWLTTDWDELQRHSTHNLAAIQHGAEGVKQFLTGYLPSAGAAAAGVFFGIQEKVTGRELKSDTDTAATAAATTAEPDTTEHVPPGTGRPTIIRSSGIPSMEMFDIQRGEAIVGLIHFFDRGPRDLPDNRHPGPFSNRRRIEELFLQREEPAFGLHPVRHRFLVAIQRELQYFQLRSTLQRLRLENLSTDNDHFAAIRVG